MGGDRREVRWAGPRRGGLLACTALTALLAAAPSWANPKGGGVVAGAATIIDAGSALTVHQTSDRAIVDWRGFSIGAGETTRFVQPSARAAILNRVTGGDPSALLGQLSANGQVYLINPHGVVVGPGGRVDTAGFVASTRDVADDAFLRGGPLTFEGLSGAGVQVLGAIKATDGDVVLIAATVDNHGDIAAPDGQAVLAAGDRLFYLPGGQGDIVIAAQTSGASITNGGAISAASVQMRAAGGAYALAVNNSGQVSATAVRQVGGRVVLDAGDGGLTDSGTIQAQAGDRGGAVTLAGRTVALTGAALIDVSGSAGGGVVSIGGGRHGADPAIRNARDVGLDAGVRIRADATTSGDGGQVTVWADGATRFFGSIQARGGPGGGDGGQVEVSGGDLTFAGQADLTAPRGAVGDLLLDPVMFDVDAAAATSIVNALATANVLVDATDTVTVNSAIVSASGNTLTLDGVDAVVINANVSLTNGTLTLGKIHAAPGASLSSVAGAAVSALVINLSGSYGDVNLAGPVSTSTLNYDQSGVTSTAITMANSANSIGHLHFIPGHAQASGAVGFASGSAMTVSGTMVTTGALTLVAAGDLTLQSGAVLDAGGLATLASTGGAFVNQAGAGLIAGAGRTRIYTATPTGFSDGGLGYAQFDANYPSDPASGNVVYLAVVVAPLPILTITANDARRPYGQPDPAFTAAFSGGSVADLTLPVRFRLSQAEAVNVGTYAIIPYGATSSTAQVDFVNGVLTVTPAPLLITADNASRLYGGANPAFSAGFSGLVNGDGAAVVSGLVLTTSASAVSGVGGYAITPSGARATNYDIGYASGALTVAPAPLTVTANGASRLYGDANPSFSARISGLVNGDPASVVAGLTFATSATAASNVGGYAITPSGARAANYAVAFVDGALTITPAPLIVTANDVRQTVGAAFPAFTARYDGLRNDDDPSRILALSLTANASERSGAGDYFIIPGGYLTGPANYTLSFVYGALTLLPKPIVNLVDQSTIILRQDTTTIDSTLIIGGHADLDFKAADPKLFEDHSQQVLVCGPGCMLFRESAAQPEFNAVIDRFVASMSGSATPPVTVNTVKLALTDADTSPTMMGTLLPFLFTDLSLILDKPQGQWSPSQAAFVQAFQTYVQDQRRAAAAKALADYQTWAKQQYDERSGDINAVKGVGQIYVAGILSTSPPIPPASLQQQIDVGYVLNNGQLADYALMSGQAGKVGEALIGTPTTPGEIVVIPGAVADVARIAELSALFSGLGQSGELVKAVPALTNVLPFAVATGERAVTTAKMILQEAADLAEAGVKVADVASQAARVAQAQEILAGVSKGLSFAEAIPVVGLVVDLVGNALQVAITISQYASISDFNKGFSDSYDRAQQPVGVAELKQMMADPVGQKQMFTYLATMAATGGKPPATDKPTLTLQQVAALSLAL